MTNEAKNISMDILKWLLMIFAGSILAAGGFVGGRLWDHERRIGIGEFKRAEIIAESLKAKSDAENAISVTAQHGKQLVEIRGQLSGLKSELKSSVAILSQLIRESCSPDTIVTQTMWETERTKIQSQFDEMNKKLDMIVQRIDSFVQSHDKHSIN